MGGGGGGEGGGKKKGRGEGRGERREKMGKLSNNNKQGSVMHVPSKNNRIRATLTIYVFLFR